MTHEIIRSDTRLLLFRAMECGLQTKLMDDAFLDKFRKQGAQMAFIFAKRYYNVVYEAYLRHASHCVLGVINIGLIESSENQLDNAVGLLLKRGFVGVFREGWSRILNLVHFASAADISHQKTEFDWQKDFCESFSAEPGRKWIGYDEYRYYMLLYSKGAG